MPITLTDAASERIARVLIEEQDPRKRLRLAIQGGGCAGFEYVFSLDEPQSEDIVVKGKAAELLIDPISLQYLQGAQLDFKEGLQGASFVLRNPNARTTCGCGTSFAA